MIKLIPSMGFIVLVALATSREVVADEAGAVFRLSVTTPADARQSPVTVRVVMTGISGNVPVVVPGWTCAWSRAWARGDESLVVECIPRDDTQGVSTVVYCSDLVPSQQATSIMITTLEGGESRRARVDLFCQTH